ncbi:MAG: transfer protein Tra, partial [Jiangellaceae bacterium]
VWRAAMQVGAEDRRPTGPLQLQNAARARQRHLDPQAAGDRAPAQQEWGWLLDQVNPNLTEDDFAPLLADRLAAITRAGVDAAQLLHSAASTGGPLPDDHAAAALWWRISRHLTPAVAAQIDTEHTQTTAWTSRLDVLLGSDRADDLESSPWWPPLVAAVEQALERGWRLDDLIRPAGSQQDGFEDLCQALLWRISLLTDPIPTDDPYEPFLDSVPPDMWPDTEPGAGIIFAAREEIAIRPSGVADLVVGEAAGLDWVEPDLAVAALIRGVAAPPEQTDADIDRMFTRAMAWRECPVSRDRMVQINQMTLAYFRSHFPGSWGQTYLTDRFGQDLTDDPRFRAGQRQPAGPH